MSQNRAALHGVIISDLQARLELQERKENAQRAEEQLSTPRALRRNERAKKDWDAIFRNLDLTVANDLSLAQRRFRKTEPPFYQDQFFKEAASRVAVGKEAEYVAALAEAPEFDLYLLRSFLESVPAEWKPRLSVKSALANTLRTFCCRFCMQITRGRYFEVLPFKTACELAGIPESDVIDVVLSSIGEVTEIVGVGRLFTLVGLLSAKLSRSELLEALGYGLQLFDAVLKDTDGDGPWSPQLTPPAEIDSAIAGYIFGGLASPTAVTRWEAAHAVHAVCLFQHRQILSSLVALADGSRGGTFADARLFFYHLHARLWLLIALARAAIDRPDALAAHSDFVLKYVQISEMHVLIREFGKRCALTLIDAGLLAPDLRGQIASVNVSPFPAIEARWFEREAARPATATEEEEQLYFGYDMERHWFAPLARCFGLGEKDIERHAATVITMDWRYRGRLHWEEDERGRRKILKPEDTYESQGSDPRAHDLSFYLSFHAMMVVAGQLLATRPTFRSPDYAENDFSEWLHSRHDLSCREGYWLADRRDPIPVDTHGWKYEKATGEWRSSVWRNDFTRVLFPSAGMATLWGYWNSVSGRRQETCNVRSALVSRGQSRALLRALQSVDNHRDYLIPDAEDDHQIGFGIFQLKGWIADRSHDSGIDEKDPWAGGIRYPASSPSREVLEAMNLVAERDDRNWRQSKATQDAMAAETWGTFREKGNETSEEHGDRIRASLHFVGELLRKFNMDMT